MKLCTDLILDGLSAIYQVERYGSDIETLSLNPPMFFSKGQPLQRDSVYICPSGDFAPSGRAMNCLFIVSGMPSSSLASSRNSVIVLKDGPALMEVFNVVQGIFARYAAWEETLREHLRDDLDVSEMLRVTSELMDECIGICNKDLKIVSFHNPHPETEVSFQHLTGDGINMFLDSHPWNVSQRSPFIFQGDGSSVYCLNIYKNDDYLGVLTLPDMYHELTRGRMLLFDFFYEYIFYALDRLDVQEGSMIISLKMVFKGILAGESIGEDEMRKVSSPRGEKNMWLCLAAKLTEPMRRLPAEYFCKQIEATNEQVVAVESDGYVAMVLPVANQARARELEPSFVALIQKLFGVAGASIAFNNLSNARVYFQQAVAACKTASLHGCSDPVAHFGDWSFKYILDICISEFTPKYLLPKELLELRGENAEQGDVDYWETLKCYLDNGMNVSATARDLFIHRTTLQYRLDRIAKRIDISDPANRLYIHLCIYLYDTYEALLNNAPMSS